MCVPLFWCCTKIDKLYDKCCRLSSACTEARIFFQMEADHFESCFSVFELKVGMKQAVFFPIVTYIRESETAF